MSDERFAELRPRDLAAVWGTAVGQLFRLWTAGFTSLLETGSGESTITGSDSSDIIVRAVGGRPPLLVARNLVGESFGKSLDGNAVIFTKKGPAGSGHVLVNCKVDESRVQRIEGDIYRGEVVDEKGRLIALIELDAGS